MLIIRFIVLLVLNSSFGSSFISADTCSTISGSTETISTNCGPLEISGDGSNVTINSGVTIENKNTTVKTPNATNAVITNNGTIKTSEGSSALRNTLPGDISDLTNNGLITATANDGIRNGGTIDNLTNSGQISANRYGIRNLAGNGRLIGTLANSGEISAIDHSGIKNDGIIETLSNSGEIKAKNQGIWTKGTITTLTNSGTISAENTHAIKIVPGATIGTLTNSGTISAGGDFAIRNDESDINSNIISKISNSGIISANRNGIWNDATITSLTNSGTIRTINQDFAIKNVRGTIGTLTNSGSITAGRDWAIYNDATATISRLTNTGIISSSNNNIGIYNHGGTITTLDNDQSTLTYRGALPTNYKAIINSPSDYGKITFSDVSGTTNFGVHSSSILTEATYNSVISGITSGDIASGTSGKHSNPNACNDVNGTVASFSSNCADLDISGNNADVTINSGVTISGEGDLDWVVNNSSGTLWDLVVTDELHQIQNTGYNNALTNLGIIAATENSSNAINNEESFATIINNGTISSNGSHAIHNNTSASITTLTNSGVISSTNNNAINNIGLLSSITNTGTISGGDYGINNTGTIGYISNTGSISDGNNIGIFNDDGTITTLDNSQSDLTYKGVLPTNYNAIISGPSDYGKITFSDASGAINFGVHASSTLAVGTYDSVMSGLNANNIASGTSGTFVSGADRINWTLENSGSIWNLVVEDKIDIIPDTNISIKTSVKTNTIDTFNDLNSVIEVNFANMNTYDCDSFGERNGCLSIGGRNTQINNPKTKTNAIVLIGGYKLSDSFRIAGFYHRNYEHVTPKRFKLSDKTPLLGTLIVWNQFTNGLGLQIKLATAFQKKHATLIREVIGSSEEGRAITEISTKSKVIEFQQGYRLNNDIILRPYLAFRKAASQQDAYVETGIESPLSFNAIRDEMITALFGLKFDIDRFGDLPEELSFRGSMGIEYDLTHSVSKIKPEGISGLTTVSLTESFNEKRPVVSLGFDYEIKANRKFSGTTQYQELPYENKNETNYYLYYTQGF